MKVRILSGNQTGTIIDMPQIEAENNISTGFAELYEPKRDQATLDKNKADVPKVSKKEAERLVSQSPSARPKGAKAGKATPKPSKTVGPKKVGRKK